MHPNSTYQESDGEEKLKHSLLMAHQVVQHTLLRTYGKMEENVHISDSKGRVADKDADKKQHLDVAYLLGAYPEKSILKNSERCLESMET